MSRSGAAHRISVDVFAQVGLKAGSGQKRPRKKNAIVSPPEARKKKCQSTNVGACGGRPQSTDRGGDKAGEDEGKGTEGAEGRRKPPTAGNQGS